MCFDIAITLKDIEVRVFVLDCFLFLLGCRFFIDPGFCFFVISSWIFYRLFQRAIVVNRNRFGLIFTVRVYSCFLTLFDIFSRLTLVRIFFTRGFSGKLSFGLGQFQDIFFYTPKKDIKSDISDVINEICILVTTKLTLWLGHRLANH